MITRRLFITGSVALAGAAIATNSIAAPLSNDEKTVILLKKVVENNTNENIEELYSHLLVYPETKDIEKLKRYWNNEELKRISLDFGNGIRELDGIVPVIVSRMHLSVYNLDFDHTMIPSYKEIAKKHSSAVLGL